MRNKKQKITYASLFAILCAGFHVQAAEQPYSDTMNGKIQEISDDNVSPYVYLTMLNETEGAWTEDSRCAYQKIAVERTYKYTLAMALTAHALKRQVQIHYSVYEPYETIESCRLKIMRVN